jgi:hypothetical protein
MDAGVGRGSRDGSGRSWLSSQLLGRRSRCEPRYHGWVPVPPLLGIRPSALRRSAICRYDRPSPRSRLAASVTTCPSEIENALNAPCAYTGTPCARSCDKPDAAFYGECSSPPRQAGAAPYPESRRRSASSSARPGWCSSGDASCRPWTTWRLELPLGRRFAVYGRADLPGESGAELRGGTCSVSSPRRRCQV